MRATTYERSGWFQGIIESRAPISQTILSTPTLPNGIVCQTTLRSGVPTTGQFPLLPELIIDPTGAAGTGAATDARETAGDSAIGSGTPLIFGWAAEDFAIESVKQSVAQPQHRSSSKSADGAQDS